ncbi:GntR family transcriptional regulator [Gracilibacillus oryzae]|uniref:GntR family transcriptional regulator n=1 Tax=Gracilibacillus oryzae TaxID=1672701 RepID=A0A7C8GUW9_9BACI|nr:GntR family transcriptional regulator [Gracilibacillus oryzae]KAB8137807.1 GntR family transcriptional regulator [Gracilibacillus oryzae]
MIDKNSPLPIYYQLEQAIRAQIQQGELQPGELLPSEKAYTEKYNISRMTVRQAINNLAQEGLLVRMKGKGTFIAEQKIQQTLKGITSFSEEMKQKGKKAASRIITLEEVNANPYIAEKLDVDKDSSIWKLKRVRLADQIPIAFETSYMPKKIVGEIKEENFAQSFYDYVENTLQLKITHGNQDIESTLAEEEDKEYLELEEGSPILLINRLTYVDGNRPFEYVRTAYRADKYKYKLSLPR